MLEPEVIDVDGKEKEKLAKDGNVKMSIPSSTRSSFNSTPALAPAPALPKPQTITQSEPTIPLKGAT